MRIWHGRHAEPLVIVWVIALALIGGLYKIENIQPALSTLFRPVYFVVLAVVSLVTWRWFRSRAAGKQHERRHRDRRQSDRRGDE
ncbi:MAG: hypothetical protein ABI035_03855 [Gemmatimonadaceae bacterium]